ncbi:hypothetical protein [Streptomyces olivochromogenes]|nr:hypothetical protein [Streptomyces olivochromogenes]MCF3133185.1 hypothetical protein [Streptomyces olivochromogenes]
METTARKQRGPAAQRPAGPARGLAVLDGLVAATMLTIGRPLTAGA